MATVRRVIDNLMDEQLRSSTTPMLEPGWPQSEGYPVRDCLLIVLSEEWQRWRQ